MVFKKTREAFVDIMGYEPDEINLESHMYDELDADSLDMSQILLALENAYQIEIENEDVADMDTVSDLVSHIEKLIA